MTATTRILVSSQTDDLVGQELFSQLDSVEVIPYDPTTTKLDERQRQAEILVPPYRGTNRPMALMAQMPNLRMVQITAAGTDEWANDVPDGVVLAGVRGCTRQTGLRERAVRRADPVSPVAGAGAVSGQAHLGSPQVRR